MYVIKKWRRLSSRRQITVRGTSALHVQVLTILLKFSQNTSRQIFQLCLFWKLFSFADSELTSFTRKMSANTPSQVYIRRGVRSDVQLSCTETRFQKCSELGSLFVIFLSFSGQLKVRYSQSLQQSEMYTSEESNWIYCLPWKTCNHLENAMCTSKHKLNIHG